MLLKTTKHERFILSILFLLTAMGIIGLAVFWIMTGLRPLHLPQRERPDRVSFKPTGSL